MRSKEPTEPPRKRSRRSEDADDVAVTAGGKKVRGRPRVDTQDATAADVSIDPFNKSHLSSLHLNGSCASAARNTKTDATTSVEERRFVSLNAHIGNAKRQRYPHSSNRALNYTLSSRR